LGDRFFLRNLEKYDAFVQLI